MLDTLGNTKEDNIVHRCETIAVEKSISLVPDNVLRKSLADVLANDRCAAIDMNFASL